MKFVDLSVPLNENTPVYPEDPHIKITQGGVLDKDGYEDYVVSIGAHVGTHIDAPAHMVKGGKNLDEFGIDKFTGRGIYVDARKDFDFVEIEEMDIREGDIVLFHTGMSVKYGSPDYFDSFPPIDDELAEYLVIKKVKMVGVDMCSVDHEPFPIHKIFLKSNILIIENLTNLEKLQGRKFKVFAFPIKLQLDGGPVRVVAEIIE